MGDYQGGELRLSPLGEPGVHTPGEVRKLVHKRKNFWSDYLAKHVFQGAFSLLELLLVLAILGAMLFITVPYGQGLSGKNRALAYTVELKAALRFTRSRAILFGEAVTFCGSKDHERCDGLWQEGQIVVTKSGKVLRVLAGIVAGDKLFFLSSRGIKDRVVFTATGFTQAQRGSFVYCPKNNPENALAVILLPAGRIRVSSLDAFNRRISCNF